MGIIYEKYRSGINLGGWISQSKYEKQHIAEFITQEDIKKISSWGADHIRLPVDYPVLESEDGYKVIDKTLDWCKQENLNLVLDLHKAPGYAFGNKKEDNILFTDETAQNSFVAIWEKFATRYKAEGDHLIFELLNEIIDPHGDIWNKIARRAIEAIHAIDPDRYIILGGPWYNSVHGLKTLEIYDNPRVLYNFHFYEPMYVTHQRASWTPLRDTGIHQSYPAKVEGVEILQPIIDEMQYTPVTADEIFDIGYLEKCLAPAIQFSQTHNKELYCGEYGCIDNASLESRISYISDTNALFEKYKMGRALWSYKKMNFTSIDENNDPISQELPKILNIKE